MNNTKAYEILSNMEYNKIIFCIASLLKDECNTENLILITYLIRYDLDFVGSCKDATEFESKVLATAKMNGAYAGMDYEYGDFLAPDDELFTAPDDGLSWVTFGDLWDTLMKVATDNVSILD